MINVEIHLKDLCEDLGWQGGTIHQVRDVLRRTRRLCEIHKECELTNDWDSFKGQMYSLGANVKGRNK